MAPPAGTNADKKSGASKPTKKVKKSKKKGATKEVSVEDPAEKPDKNDGNKTPKPTDKSAKTRTKKDDKLEPAAEAAADRFFAKYGGMGQQGIVEEYKKEVSAYLSPKYTFASFTANPTCNRYKDVVCLDDSRVGISGARNYIHANWVNDYNISNRRYIMTQAPLDTTIEDFWKMVFEHEVSSILMLCGIKENGETLSAEYWPRAAGEFKNYGTMFVSNKKKDAIEKETVFTLEVLPEGCSNSVITRIVQYEEWNLKTMSTARQLMKVTKLVDKLEGLGGGSNRPIVVMDSSGVDRAALLVLNDFILNQLYFGNTADVPELCRWLRRARASSLRTEEQYLFLIQSILEYYYNTNQKKYAAVHDKLCPQD